MTGAGCGERGVLGPGGDDGPGFLFDEDVDAIGPKSKFRMIEVPTGTRPDLMRDGC